MKPRDITIKTVLNGWIAQVGCQTLVFSDLKVLIKDLEAYLENPEVMETHYQNNSVNSEFFNFAEVCQNPYHEEDRCEQIRQDPWSH